LVGFFYFKGEEQREENSDRYNCFYDLNF